MIENEKTLIKFYTAFANNDVKTICECYHANVQFRDPAFGLLKEKEVCSMWKMLIENGKGNIKIEYSDIQTDEYIGSAKCIATYNFSKTNRKVVNKIQSQFQFQEGLIIKQTDNFDIWNWAKQALGLKGFLFGWTGYMQNKIQKNALLSLKKYKQD